VSDGGHHHYDVSGHVLVVVVVRKDKPKPPGPFLLPSSFGCYCTLPKESVTPPSRNYLIHYSFLLVQLATIAVANALVCLPHDHFLVGFAPAVVSAGGTILVAKTDCVTD
jgi:hypothetical protein